MEKFSKFGDMLSYDPDGFIARKPGATRGEDGNPWVTHAMGLVIKDHVGRLELEDDNQSSRLFRLLSFPGVDSDKLPVAKKFYSQTSDPHVSYDEVTKDDVVGQAVVSVLTHRMFHTRLSYIGQTRYYYGSPGEFYFNAIVWPWDRCFFAMLGGWEPTLFQQLTFAAGVYLDGLFNKKSMSDKQLLYLKGSVMQMHVAPVVAKAFNWWRKRTKMREVLAVYYGQQHPFTLYFRDAFEGGSNKEGQDFTQNA